MDITEVCDIVVSMFRINHYLESDQEDEVADHNFQQVTTLLTIATEMPGLIQENQFKTLTVRELHPTFAAEVSGVNFNDVPEEQFSEILEAMAKVR